MSVERLFDIPFHQLERFPKPESIASKADGAWKAFSTQQVIDLAEKLSLGLMAMGVGPGDKVAVASGNRAEWCLVDLAILRIGAVNVPLYPTASSEDYTYVLAHCEAKACFSSNAEIHAKVRAAQENAPALRHLFTFDRLPDARHWTDLQELANGQDRTRLNEYAAAVKGHDLATIIYTSGTTGRPKGVMLSHANVLSNVLGSIERFPVDHTATCISFLPLCHIYERMLMYLYLYTGVSIRFQESMDNLGDAIREVRPDVFTAVPRVLEKVYDRIVAKGEELKGVKRALFFWALDLGLRYESSGRSAWYDLQLGVARRLVFSKWQAALGGRVRVVASGSAALQPRLARVFNAAGIPLMEGYGLTESSPVISVNCEKENGFRIGTVGRPLRNVEVRIADDGEILARGPNIMKGYYKEPELTRDALDTDGWLHTGDIGVLESGFLRITDRKKEIFKTSGGKYIAPQMIENRLKESRFIEQAMVIGENRKFPAALIVPNAAFLRDYCALKGIPYTNRIDILTEPRITARIKGSVDKLCAGLGHWEQVKKIALLPNEWTIEGGELTPSLKLKRKAILAKYAAAVERIYGSE